MQNINLYYFWNDFHKVFLDEYFLPSFNEHHNGDINLIGKKFEQSNVHCLFGTPEYKKLLTERAHYLIELTKTTEKDNFFIFSDIDVQFFGNIKKIIDKMIDLDHDMVFQKEDIDGRFVNFGLMLIKSNEATLKFWEEILIRLESNNYSHTINDQNIGNTLLDLINYSTFDSTIWNWSQGNLDKNIILHHANCVTDIKAKIDQLNNVKNYIIN